MTARPDRRRVLADLSETRRDWFHLGPVRNEVVGDVPAPDGEPAARTTADVYIFDLIGGWSGVTADDFVRDVAGLDVDHLDVHLNSPGGEAWEAVAIANVLRKHRADVTVWVDGIAASAASVIAMAGDEIVMGIGSQLMIHDAAASTWGNAADLRKGAEMLDSASNSLAGTYASKAGGTAAEWRDVMIAETWYTAEEAVTAGLADRVATAEDKGTASGEQVVPGQKLSFYDWNLWDSLSDANRHTDALRALYAHASRADAPPPQMPGRPGAPQAPAASAGGSTPSQEGALMPTLIEGLRQRLGLAEDADESAVLAALDARPAATEQPRAALPEGAVVVDGAALEQLRTDAALGAQARAEQIRARREGIVEAAIQAGKVLPRARASWLKNVEVDEEGTAATLAEMSPIVALAEKGHDQQPAAKDDLGWFGADTTPQEG